MLFEAVLRREEYCIINKLLDWSVEVVEVKVLIEKEYIKKVLFNSIKKINTEVWIITGTYGGIEGLLRFWGLAYYIAA